MEILFVSHKYPPSVGGMEKQSFELIEGVKPYAKVHTLVYKGGGKLWFFLSLAKKITLICRENPEISVVHFNDGLIGAICAQHRGYTHCKRVVTLHGLEVVFPNKWYQKYIFPRFNRFNLVIAVSTATRDACLARGIDPNRVAVVPNGVDHELANLLPVPDFAAFFEEKYHLNVRNKKILVTMGRAVQRKGFSWLMENVLPRLSGEFVLLMIGPFQRKKSRMARFMGFLPPKLARQLVLFLGFPSDEDHLRHLLNSPRFQGKVYHLGKLPFGDVQQILAASTAFLMPNVHINGDMEGFGLVCLEAALSGTRVLAADLEGITDAIQNGKNGVLLPSGDADAWTLEIQKLLDETSLDNHDLARYKKYTLEHFSWAKMARDYVRLFEQCR